MLKKIAVTGGIASGKTTVCRMLEELGATVLYTDAIVHDLLQPHTEVGKKIIRDLGSVDRKTLSEKVFQDPKALQRLEALLHPEVFKTIDQAYAKAKGTYFVVEIPLLYEIGAQDRYDLVIVVDCDPEIAKKRFSKGGQEYELRMQRQIRPEIKAASAHIVISNNGDLTELRRKVHELWNRWHSDA
ncbi:MAG: dephospho-CoA kinase [Verrucomicrobia bacterium]|nr:dephospho-CoA kinase [Verrucomicrobiota bacterium]MBU6446931.1 dephospho-CoA kinase [Verrucomicrobiota bacterium]MDE3046715.1 dephospho-CoA kinase [Verrucomicrobiota bacterium]